MQTGKSHIHIHINNIQRYTSTHSQIHTRSNGPTIAHTESLAPPLPHRYKTHLNLLSSVLQNLRPSIWRIETRLAITPASIKGQEGDRFAGVVWAVLSGRAKAGRGERTILFTIAFLTVSLMHGSPLLRLGVARSVQFVMSA